MMTTRKGEQQCCEFFFQIIHPLINSDHGAIKFRENPSLIPPGSDLDCHHKKDVLILDETYLCDYDSYGMQKEYHYSILDPELARKCRI